MGNPLATALAARIKGGAPFDELARALQADPDPASAIRALAAHEDAAVRIVAAELARAVLPVEPATAILSQLASHDARADVRDTASEMLVDSGQYIPAAVVDALRTRLTSDTPQPELQYAIWTLAKLRDRQALPALRELSTAYPWPPGQRAAEVAAAVIEGQDEALMQRLANHDHDLRVELAVGVGLIGSRAAFEALSAWASAAPDDLCRAATQWAIDQYVAGAKEGESPDLDSR